MVRKTKLCSAKSHDVTLIRTLFIKINFMKLIKYFFDSLTSYIILKHKIQMQKKMYEVELKKADPQKGTELSGTMGLIIMFGCWLAMAGIIYFMYK